MGQAIAIAIAAAPACTGDTIVETATTIAASESQCGPSQPLAPVCNTSVCVNDAGWIFWPRPAGFACSTPDGSGECDGGETNPLSNEPERLGECVIGVGSIDPKYHVLSVIYSPPGRTGGGQTSVVTYAEGSSAGSTTDSAESVDRSFSLTAEATIPLIEQGGQLSLGYQVVNATSDALAIRKVSTNIITHTAPPLDGIDHDEDEIWVWMNPRMYFTDAPSGVKWTFGIGTGHTGTDMEVQPLKVGWLKGTLPMPPGVANELAFHGFTADDFADLLEYDEFANGNTTIDPARFLPTGVTFPYLPPTSSAGTSSSRMYSLTNEQALTHTATTTKVYSVGATLNITVIPFISKLTASTRWSWTYRDTHTTSNGEAETATAHVRGPSFGYTGPTTVRVYYDTLFKTFLFDFVRVPTPFLRGRVSNLEVARPGEPVFLRIGTFLHTTYTDESGEYRFFEVPVGTHGEVWSGNLLPRDVTVSNEIQRVDFDLGPAPKK